MKESKFVQNMVRNAIHWNAIWRLMFVVALYLPVTGARAAPDLPPRIQPQLLTLAATQPDTIVRIIVQKATRGAAVEEAVVRLGGIVIHDLSMINAFAAEMTAGAVHELATTPAVRWVSLDAPVQSSATKFSVWATKIGTVVPNGFINAANIPALAGSNGTYGYGKNVKGAFGGFTPEYAPGQVISKVEVILRMYASASLGAAETPKITAYVGGQPSGTVVMPTAPLNGCVGASKVCSQYVDITASRTWRWSDFANNLEIAIDQTALAKTSALYYDAVGLRLTTANGNDASSPLVLSSEADSAPVNTSVLTNVFQKATRAENIWNESPYWQGSGVTVAVVDSGSFKTNAIGQRFIGEVNFNSTEHNSNDQYGHGSFVTSLVADDGDFSAGKYMGIAPRVNVLGVRVSDDLGMAYESDVVASLQWILNNKATYNIKVVNLSLNSDVWQSYHTSPLCAAAEFLWFNGIVIVTAAGNNGTATLYPPANDPFVITVGATDDLNTASLTDDVIASFSAYGTDEANQVKPDIVAPGRNLIAYLPDTNLLSISVAHPENRVDANYFRMSGTSMATPLVSGAAAILLQANPNLTPDQVKYRLKTTANQNWPNYNALRAGSGYLDVYAAVKGTSTQSANSGLVASQLLWTGSEPITWGSVSWNSVSWNSVSWNSVSWNSVSWNSVSWNSDYWEGGVVAANSVAAESNDAQEVDMTVQNNVVFLPIVSR